MNQSLPFLIEAMQRVMRQEILPELNSDYARNQLLGLLDILEKLQRLVVWSPDVMREQLTAIEEGCSQFEAMACSFGQPAPSGRSIAQRQQLTQADLAQDLENANNRLIELTDWLYAPNSRFAPDERAHLESLMRETIQKMVAVERRLVSRSDFSAMSGTTGD